MNATLLSQGRWKLIYLDTKADMSKFQTYDYPLLISFEHDMVLTKSYYAYECSSEHNCTLLPWRTVPIDDDNYHCNNCSGYYQTRLNLCHDCYIGYSKEQSITNINMDVIYKKQHIAVQCYDKEYIQCGLSITHTDLIKRDIMFNVKFVKWWKSKTFQTIFHKVMKYNFWLISDLMPMDLKIAIMQLMFALHEKKRAEWKKQNS